MNLTFSLLNRGWKPLLQEGREKGSNLGYNKQLNASIYETVYHLTFFIKNVTIFAVEYEAV